MHYFLPPDLVTDQIKSLTRRRRNVAKDITMQRWGEHKRIGINAIIQHAIHLTKERFCWCLGRRIKFSDCHALDCSKPGHPGHGHHIGSMVANYWRWSRLSLFVSPVVANNRRWTRLSLFVSPWHWHGHCHPVSDNKSGAVSGVCERLINQITFRNCVPSQYSANSIGFISLLLELQFFLCYHCAASQLVML